MEIPEPKYQEMTLKDPMYVCLARPIHGHNVALIFECERCGAAVFHVEKHKRVCYGVVTL